LSSFRVPSDRQVALEGLSVLKPQLLIDDGETVGVREDLAKPDFGDRIRLELRAHPARVIVVHGVVHVRCGKPFPIAGAYPVMAVVGGTDDASEITKAQDSSTRKKSGKRSRLAWSTT